MANEVVMPRLGWTMEQGTLVEWLKQPGEMVQAGDVLFTVESDKALNEVEAFDTGTLHIPGNAPKDQNPFVLIRDNFDCPGQQPNVHHSIQI